MMESLELLCMCEDMGRREGAATIIGMPTRHKNEVTSLNSVTFQGFREDAVLLQTVAAT